MAKYLLNPFHYLQISIQGAHVVRPVKKGVEIDIIQLLRVYPLFF